MFTWKIIKVLHNYLHYLYMLYVQLEIKIKRSVVPGTLEYLLQTLSSLIWKKKIKEKKKN